MPRGRNAVNGEHLAQLSNRDPFAVPVWRSPVYRTPEGVILVVQLIRVVWRVLWFALTHPALDAVIALVVVTWSGLGWPGLVGLAAVTVTGLVSLRVMQPEWFARFVAAPVRDWLQWLFYRRRWKAAMILAGLAPDYRGQPMLPVLGKVHLQYFAAMEPQRRLAPHVHIAIRGTIARAEIHEVLAATYHQVWWPSTQAVQYDGDYLPVWDETSATYLDPATGEVLPTWDEAVTAIGDQDEPRHVVRFGDRFDAQGVLAGSRDASRCIGYLTKYLTKHLGDCHQAATADQAAHADRLADALRYEPCSPTCANWLRYGIQPKNARPGLCPGACKGKAHRREYLGYGGRRVLVSRKWSGKTLADHRGDRKTWLMQALGLPATDPSRYTWEPVKPGDLDHMPNGQRLLHVVADRIQWQTALEQARRRAAMETASDHSATGTAA